MQVVAYVCVPSNYDYVRENGAADHIKPQWLPDSRRDFSAQNQAAFWTRRPSEWRIAWKICGYVERPILCCNYSYPLLGILLLIRSKVQTANKFFGIEDAQATFLQRSECCLKLKNWRVLPKVSIPATGAMVKMRTSRVRSLSWAGKHWYTPLRKRISWNHT